MTDLIIYRTCDRPKYVERTLAINMERSSDGPVFLVFDNSTDKQEAQDVTFSIAPDVEFYQTDQPRIGGTRAVMTAVELYARKLKVLDKVFVIDDDVIVPEPLEDGTTWDQILAEMLDAGWDVVAHPWSNDFRSKPTKFIGGVEGYPYSSVNGGCSAFRYSFYKKNPMSQITLIRGYNEWMTRRSRDRNGYSANGRMVFQHIDRPEHPLSLRDTEYCDWSDAMYYERFPDRKGQKRPKGSRGVW